MKSDVDLLIRGSNVYDGSGDGEFVADVGISGDRIACILKAPERYKGSAGKIIEAKGLSLAPGFIDTHAHSEFTLIAESIAAGVIIYFESSGPVQKMAKAKHNVASPVKMAASSDTHSARSQDFLAGR